MVPRIVSSKLINSFRKSVPICFILCGLVSSCGPVPQVLESTPGQTSAADTPEFYSNERFGFCFSYPQGYAQLPYNDAVEIVAPNIGPGDEFGLFWLEISDSQNRTAEQVAIQEFSSVAGLTPGRWNVMLGGEQALVLDGMSGQDLVRRVYIVRQETLYILTFSPTRSANAAAGEQMETLYAAVTGSWAWAPCSAGE